MSDNFVLFKVDNKSTRKRCEICPQVNNKNTRNVIDAVDFADTVDFKQVNVSWVSGIILKD